MSCTPYTTSIKECGFASFEKKVFDEPFEKWIELLLKGKTPFFKIDVNNEFLDYLEEFPVIELKKGTVICHTSQDMGLIKDENELKIEKIDVNNGMWWNKYYPGFKNNGGGWFTFENEYGGPNYKYKLYYELKDDVSLLFIPNVRHHFNEKNLDYYSEEDFEGYEKYENIEKLKELLISILFFFWRNGRIFPDLEKAFKENLVILRELTGEFKPELEQLYQKIISNPEIKYTELEIKDERDIADIIEDVENVDNKLYRFLQKKQFSASHLFRGVKGWKEKGYSEISYEEDQAMTGLSNKLNSLGFNGYISCDLCEIFLTFDVMKRVLSQPFFVGFNLSPRRNVDDDERKFINEILTRYNSRFYTRPQHLQINDNSEPNYQDVKMLDNKNFSL